jgi:hypothetical protein
MSHLLLFAGGRGGDEDRLRLAGTEGFLLLDDGTHLVLSGADDAPDLTTVHELAGELLARLDFGLSDEELLRQVILQWGSEPLAAKIEALAGSVDPGVVQRLLPQVIEAGKAARDGDHLEEEEANDISLLQTAMVVVIMAIATIAAVVWADHSVEQDGTRLAAVGPMLTLLTLLYQVADGYRDR